MNCNTRSPQYADEKKIYIITNVPVTMSTEERIRRLMETQKTEIAAIIDILYCSFR